MHILLLLLVVPALGLAQDPPHLATERADFVRWLETSPVSPFAAVYHQPLAPELALGRHAEPPLDRVPTATLVWADRGLRLRTDDGERVVPRNRPLALGEWQLLVSSSGDDGFVTVFRPLDGADPPGWYPYAPDLVVEGMLERSERREVKRMLGLDGVIVEASLAGTFVGSVAGQEVRLTVFRMPIPGSEEADLNIFFRDHTNGNGTYTAGRFLALRPLGRGRFLADFNRARNPFCAYNAVFPCPMPWAGNALEMPVVAGELYNGGGLEVTP